MDFRTKEALAFLTKTNNKKSPRLFIAADFLEFRNQLGRLDERPNVGAKIGENNAVYLALSHFHKATFSPANLTTPYGHESVQAHLAVLDVSG